MTEPTTARPREGTDGERLLRPAEVAEMLGVPRSTLYAWRYRGDGPPAYRIGKHLRYRRDAVLEWIEEQPDRRKAS
jgi:excisionase family DNA binding protein